MRVAFFGNPEFAVNVLRRLADRHQVVLVVTNPDKRSGRSMRLAPSPVKVWSEQNGLPVLTPDRLDESELVGALTASGAEATVVAAYGRLLPGWLLEAAKYGSINVHASLLPLYRGAAPIERCLMDGCESTGVTIMRMDEGMDTGDILLQESVPVPDDYDSEALRARLAEVGGGLLNEALDRIERGKGRRTSQEGTPTYADKFRPEELEFGWQSSAASIHNRVRALAPKPGARTHYRGRTLKVLRTRIVSGTSAAEPPGTVISCKHELVVAAADTPVELVEVQPENQRRMSGAEFARGARLVEGEMWER